MTAGRLLLGIAIGLPIVLGTTVLSVWLQEKLAERSARKAQEAARLRDLLADRARAVRYAEAVTGLTHPHVATLTCRPDKYVACEAARWLTERAP